ncbi:MAG: 3-hydroxyacyl-CoA dehydrogenase [Burkholderiales bacterium PBB6]|nr:MAG: 3-hydroxyacyl-CoA dehydrogenase [Burkholderiales bacterium PBB6]
MPTEHSPDSPALHPGTPVGVIGAGAMGAGIAQLAAQAGHPVWLFDMQAGAAERAVARIGDDLAGAVRRGKLTDAERDAVLARLAPAAALSDLSACGLLVEAIVERLEPKQALFKDLEALVAPHAVLATNTSSISITAVAQALQHPERVVGWHFFNPATRMKLVEIIPGLRTNPALLAPLRALSKAWGKVPVAAPNAPGFIVNRVARPYYAEALRLASEGLASFATLDRLMREAGGFALGPFELMDLIGNDVNLAVTESVFQATAFDSRYAPSLLQQERVRAGLLGRKSGQGFHDYRPEAVAAAANVVMPPLHLAANHTLACAPDLLAAASGAGLAHPLAALLLRLQATGAVLVPDAEVPAGMFTLGEALVGLTDGRTATDCALQHQRPVLLLDLALDYASTTTLGATSSQPDGAGLDALAGLLALANIALLGLVDVAGLGVMRTVACLANEAADVMTWTGTTAADIDTGMRLGTAYPRGPLAWADSLGAIRIVQVLTHLHQHYGDARYRRAPRLTRAALTGQALHPVAA